MARGGARKGAGRPAGAATAKTREIAEQASASGLTPLEYMLDLLRDKSQDMTIRMDMAKSAAPYIHPRLSSIQAQHDISERLYDFLLDRKA